QLAFALELCWGVFSCPSPSTSAHHATQPALSSARNAHSLFPRHRNWNRGGSTPLGSPFRLGHARPFISTLRFGGAAPGNSSRSFVGTLRWASGGADY